MSARGKHSFFYLDLVLCFDLKLYLTSKLAHWRAALNLTHEVSGHADCWSAMMDSSALAMLILFLHSIRYLLQSEPAFVFYTTTSSFLTNPTDFSSKLLLFF